MKLLTRFLLVFSLMFVCSQAARPQNPNTPADLRKMSEEYYNWRNQNFPVFSSDAGLHTWDKRLTDYSLSAVLARRLYAKELLGKGNHRPFAVEPWPADDRRAPAEG